MLEETFEKQRILKELELQPTDAAIQHFAVRRNSKVFIEEDCPNKSTTHNYENDLFVALAHFLGGPRLFVCKCC